MDPQDPLPSAFVIVGTVASLVLALSPLPMMLRIFRTKDVAFYRPDAFIISLPFGLANGTYSLYSNQIVSLISTAITFTLYSVFLGIFTYFAHQQRKVIIKKAVIACFSGAFVTALGPIIFRSVDSSDSGHSWFEDHGGEAKFTGIWLGVCALISIILLFSGQLTNIIHVVKTKNSSSISSSMMLGGLFASISWSIYSALILDPYYMVANGLGVLSGIVSIVLKVSYRNTASAGAEMMGTAEDSGSLASAPDSLQA